MNTSKIISLLISVSLLTFSCGSSNNGKDEVDATDVVINNSEELKNSNELTVMEFTELTHDFGKITQGEKVSFAFEFKNTGNSNLIISSAAGSCGCTVADPPKAPIAPGASGKIDVTFSSEGKSGTQIKNVTVLTNCEPNTKILTVKAEVIVPTQKNP